MKELGVATVIVGKTGWAGVILIARIRPKPNLSRRGL